MSWDTATIAAAREWEADFSRSIGGRLIPGSGNQPHAKLDVGSRSVLWSLKYGGERVVLTAELIDEAITGARGLGGQGVTPGLALRVGGYDVVVMEASDLIAILTEPGEYAVPERRADARRRAAGQTVLARRND